MPGKHFDLLTFFRNEICAPSPSGLSSNTIFPPGTHQVSVVGNEHICKWYSSSPLTWSNDYVSVF